jgi:4-amino-4-deoxychorismate lyase
MVLSSDQPHSIQVADSPDFYIFTSYLWQPLEDNLQAESHLNHLLLPYHRDRLLSAAEAFGWLVVAEALRGVAGLERIQHVVEGHLDSIGEGVPRLKAKKIKLCVYRDVHFDVHSTIIESPFDRVTSFLPDTLTQISGTMGLTTIELDSVPTKASLFTTHKTSERNHYDSARRRADIVHASPTEAEILLYNPQDEVTECSISTPYFLRNGVWVTPPLISGGNAGVTRRLALERGLCKEEVIHLHTLCHRETIWISNGVRGFLPGALFLNDKVSRVLIPG